MKIATLIAALAVACTSSRPAPMQQTAQVRMPTPWCVYAVLEVASGQAHPVLYCTDLRDFCEAQRKDAVDLATGPLSMFLKVTPRLVTLCRYEPPPVAKP